MATEAQRKYLIAIEYLTDAEACPPTYQEIADYLLVSQNAASDMCDRLERKGLIERRKKKTRSIQITDDGWDAIS